MGYPGLNVGEGGWSARTVVFPRPSRGGGVHVGWAAWAAAWSVPKAGASAGAARCVVRCGAARCGVRYTYPAALHQVWYLVKENDPWFETRRTRFELAPPR